MRIVVHGQQVFGKVPSAEVIRIDEDGLIGGLF